MMRWSGNGVLDRVFEHLQRLRLMRVRIESICLDSTIEKEHPNETGASQKTAPKRSDAAVAAGVPKCI
jgi:hypothetical protein